MRLGRGDSAIVASPAPDIMAFKDVEKDPMYASSCTMRVVTDSRNQSM
jgi:hypothetical protein